MRGLGRGGGRFDFRGGVLAHQRLDGPLDPLSRIGLTVQELIQIEIALSRNQSDLSEELTDGGVVVAGTDGVQQAGAGVELATSVQVFHREAEAP